MRLSALRGELGLLKSRSWFISAHKPRKAAKTKMMNTGGPPVCSRGVSYPPGLHEDTKRTLVGHMLGPQALQPMWAALVGDYTWHLASRKLSDSRN